ncbi:hypothetical protein JBE27_34865 [Streptomyces albiflaviniger]|nr:hypothetical protein [Streptomyces albiflaviniger]
MSRRRGRATRPARLRFDGWIAGMGTSSGTRVVLGHWERSPFGPFSDVMLDRAPETRRHPGHHHGGAGPGPVAPAGCDGGR